MPNAVKMLVVQDHTKTTLCVCLLDISMAKVSLHLSPKLFQQGQKDAMKKCKIKSSMVGQKKQKANKLRSQKGNKRQNPKSRIHGKIQCKLCLYGKLYANYN